MGRVAAALVCAAACALSVPAEVMAKPGYSIYSEYFSISATLPQSKGYHVHLESAGHRLIAVEVSRRGEESHYLAKGTANRHGIDVDLGRFGSVHARFIGHSVKREPPQAPCRARRPIELRGRLEGSIRFRGEGGYVTVASKRVKASYEHSFREVCDVGVVPPRKPSIFDVLSARGKSEGRMIRFSAFYLESIGVPVISASTVERVGRVTVWKLSISENEKSRLEFSPPTGRPQTVTVKPTFPFSGSASYAVQPDGSVDWSGDLRVSFAGLGEAALTGPGFQAEACHIRPPHGVIKCENQEGSPS
jgi:hypothetical protein